MTRAPNVKNDPILHGVRGSGCRFKYILRHIAVFMILFE